MSSLLRVAAPVATALERGRPVVALETTVVTHGLPAPDGVATALVLEETVIANGALPATIGILDGAIHVGLDRAGLERLAATPGVAKVNPGNLAAVTAAGGAGSTTVAATLFAAERAGIRVFATGGIGGVHRHADSTGDVSADLGALARHRVVVVCAGAKAILDLPKTVEMLETLGVPVLGLGTDEFPAFYRRSSGLSVDAHLADVAAVAAAVRVHFELGLPTGVVVANPVPAAEEMAAEHYDRALGAALAAVAAEGIRGRDVTPFLLERMRRLTDGESVRVNRALLVHNAAIAARLAVALAPGHGERSGADRSGGAQ